MNGIARTTTHVVLAAGLALTMGACGDKDSDSKDQAEPSTSSGAKTSVPTAGRLTQATFAAKVFSAIEKSGSAKIHFDAGETAGQKLAGDGEVRYGDDIALRMTMPSNAAGGLGEMLMIDHTIYIGMGDKYMSIPMDVAKGQGLPDLSSNLDPKVQAKAFATAVTGFEQSGKPQTLDGVSATPYKITLDPTKAPDAFGAPATGSTAPAPLHFTYWIGPDNLPRKMVFGDKGGEFTATYTDWGAPVEIEAPAASSIMSNPAVPGGTPQG